VDWLIMFALESTVVTVMVPEHGQLVVRCGAATARGSTRSAMAGPHFRLMQGHKLELWGIVPVIANSCAGLGSAAYVHVDGHWQSLSSAPVFWYRDTLIHSPNM
jgi:hypothetical protein